MPFYAATTVLLLALAPFSAASLHVRKAGASAINPGASGRVPVVNGASLLHTRNAESEDPSFEEDQSTGDSRSSGGASSSRSHGLGRHRSGSTRTASPSRHRKTGSSHREPKRYSSTTASSKTHGAPADADDSPGEHHAALAARDAQAGGLGGIVGGLGGGLFDMVPDTVNSVSNLVSSIKGGRKRRDLGAVAALVRRFAEAEAEAEADADAEAEADPDAWAEAEDFEF